MANLKNKVVLITGAGSGIGAATAINFAYCGCHLALNDLTENQLEETVKKCREAGLKMEEILLVAGNVADENSPNEIIQKTIAHFGRLDILINNAGIFRTSSITDDSMANYDLIMSVNVRANYRMIHSAAPYLKLTKGNIVNLSSTASRCVKPGFSAYCISKSAIDQLTRAMALELGPDGIRVNCVNPGLIHTNIFDHSGLTKANSKGIYDTITDNNDEGNFLKVGVPEDIAKPIAFLASDAAGFITGTSLVVDGGYLLCN